MVRLPFAIGFLLGAGSSVRAWAPLLPAQRLLARREPRLLASSKPPLDFNPTNVDKVLDEIRPYLIQDGGNIRVVTVEPETMSILVELEGACGSCPSSTTTMKMGVERVRAAAGSALPLRCRCRLLPRATSVVPSRRRQFYASEGVSSFLTCAATSFRCYGKPGRTWATSCRPRTSSCPQPTARRPP